MPSPADWPTSPPGADSGPGNNPAALKKTAGTGAAALRRTPGRAFAGPAYPADQRLAARGALRTLFFTAPCPFHFFCPRTLYAGGFDWG